MPQVTRRPLAETDILEIWDYIADDSLTAADRWVDPSTATMSGSRCERGGLIRPGATQGFFRTCSW